jgi:hypothetical protein
LQNIGTSETGVWWKPTEGIRQNITNNRIVSSIIFAAGLLWRVMMQGLRYGTIQTKEVLHLNWKETNKQ